MKNISVLLIASLFLVSCNFDQNDTSKETQVQKECPYETVVYTTPGIDEKEIDDIELVAQIYFIIDPDTLELTNENPSIELPQFELTFYNGPNWLKVIIHANDVIEMSSTTSIAKYYKREGQYMGAEVGRAI